MEETTEAIETTETIETVRSCTLTPLGGQIIVKRDPPREMSKGGIILPDAGTQGAKKVNTGRVILVGPGAINPMTGVLIPVNEDIVPGAHIMFAQYAGNDYEHDEAHGREVYTLMQEAEILCVIGEDPIPFPEGCATQEELDEAARAEQAMKRKQAENIKKAMEVEERRLMDQVAEAQGKGGKKIQLPGGR